jgi:D-alanine-D-alanine ligase-like ATP-grasp enzyme
MAEQLFAMFGLRDFARFDGWVLPDGNIWFCDFNPVSGMEQNSFLFQQASRIGLTHGQVLRHIVESACAREGITPPLASPPLAEGRADVNILFGGDTSERQVSLMSGTNVWLKLRDSRLCTPHPFLLAPDRSVWRLPYHLALNHTVEEIVENCRNYPRDKERMGRFEDRARLRLGLPAEKDTREFFDPVKMNMKEFLSNSKVVFNALHGGSGEDGRIQKLLHSHGVAFNGSDERTSALCMDKFATSRRIAALAIRGVEAIPAETVATRDIMAASVSDRAALWRQVKRRLRAKTIVVKPRADGCSTAVVHCHTSIDFGRYLDILSSGTTQAPPGTFYNQFDPIEFPEEVPAELILERFIETDIIRIKDRRLKHLRRTGWVETTIGVVEFNDGLRALSPSITVADGEVLSVEEKFQGGTGVNLTPPPMVPNRILQRVRERIRTLATRLGIRGYCRVDAFIHITTGDIMIIEINTLPGLTPATVLYHQALAEVPPMTPRVLLEHIVTQSKP